MCLIQVEAAVAVLRHVISVQNGIEADFQTIMLPVKRLEMLDPPRLHKKKRILPVYQRKRERDKPKFLQILVENRGVGEPPIGRH